MYVADMSYLLFWTFTADKFCQTQYNNNSFRKSGIVPFSGKFVAKIILTSNIKLLKHTIIKNTVEHNDDG